MNIRIESLALAVHLNYTQKDEMRGARYLLTSVLTLMWLTSPRSYYHRILNGVTAATICKTRQPFILGKITFFKIVLREQRDAETCSPTKYIFCSTGKCPWIVLLSCEEACHM